MAKKVAEGRSLGLHYEIIDRTGVVDQSDTRSETEVEGSVSGGGYGSYQTPVVGSVSSKTTHYQNIFLTDEDGKEHTIQLQDFLVPCRQGQRLTLFLLSHGNREYGSYFKAFNHNSREMSDHAKAIRSEMYPWRSFLIVIGLLFLIEFSGLYSEPDATVVSALFYTAIALAITGTIAWIIGWMVSFARSVVVRNNPEFKAYVGRLRHEHETDHTHHYTGSVTA